MRRMDRKTVIQAKAPCCTTTGCGETRMLKNAEMAAYLHLLGERKAYPVFSACTFAGVGDDRSASSVRAGAADPGNDYVFELIRRLHWLVACAVGSSLLNEEFDPTHP